MGLPQEILDVLNIQLYIERFVNRDAAGNAVYSPSESVMCILETFSKTRGAPTTPSGSIGTPIQRRLRALVDYSNYLPYDRVTIPGNQKLTVLSVDTTYDENGDPFFQQIEMEENKI